MSGSGRAKGLMGNQVKDLREAFGNRGVPSSYSILLPELGATLRDEKQEKTLPLQTRPHCYWRRSLRDRLSLVPNGRGGGVERIHSGCGRDQTVPRGTRTQPILT